MEVCRNKYLLWKYEGTRTSYGSMQEQAEQLSPKSSWIPFGRYPSMISFNCWSSNGFSSLALLIRNYLCKGIDLYSQIFIHFIQPFTLIIIISRTSPSLASRVCLNSKLELHPFTIICRLGSLTIIYRIAPIHNQLQTCLTTSWLGKNCSVFPQGPLDANQERASTSASNSMLFEL